MNDDGNLRSDKASLKDDDCNLCPVKAEVTITTAATQP